MLRRSRRVDPGSVAVTELAERVDALEWRIGESFEETAAKMAFEASRLACDVVERSLRADAVDAMATALRAAREHTEAAVSAVGAHAIGVSREHAEQACAGAQDAAIRAAREHTEAALAVLRSELVGELARIRRELVSLRRPSRTPADVTTAEVSGPASGSEHVPMAAADGAFYVDLEERFRGAYEEIKERQRSYLPLVADVADVDHPVLDLGFGRGEWLELLQESGVPARGVDTNHLSVEQGLARGFHVAEQSLVDALAAAPDHSLGAVTMFHVVEHLPFGVLVDVVEQCARVLVPGGVLIAETPNATNLRVAATTFWLDPTHVRPLHPELLEFIARRSGFSATRSIFDHRLDEPVSFDGIPDAAASWLSRVWELIDGAGDYALVAWTPGPSG